MIHLMNSMISGSTVNIYNLQFMQFNGLLVSLLMRFLIIFNFHMFTPMAIFPFMLNFNFILWLALTMIVTTILYSWSSFFVLSKIHSGEGKMMSLFLLLLHIFGEVIKPLSLSIRIFVNLAFGHFMLDLVYLYLSPFSLFFILFEIFVILVQSFVFSSLVKVYFEY